MKLREYLSAKTLTANEFGRRIGVSQAAVTRYASGARIPEPKTMRRIVEATGGAVTPNDFYDLPAPPQPRRKVVKVRIDEGLMEEAREFGTDFETLADRALEAAIIDAKRQRWREDNRDAIAEANEELARNGLWSDGLRLF